MAQITPRQPRFRFGKDIPRYWLGGSAFRSHLLNSFTLVFPTGEKFFIRSVRNVLPEIQSPELRRRAEAFIQQEAQHAIEHRKFIQILERQGYDAKRSEALIERLVRDVLEPRFGPAWRLSLTAGLEHFTALLAEIGLREEFLRGAHPVMKALFEWHAAEEIEHRSVAFDVLRECHDSYSLRVGGLAVAYVLLAGLSSACTVSLLASDGVLFTPRVVREAAQILFTRERLFTKSLRIGLRYLRPGFHPDGNADLDSLAAAVFAGFVATEAA